MPATSARYIGAHRRQHPLTPVIECTEHFGRFTLPIVALMTVMFL
jgi:hypothetical protein